MFQPLFQYIFNTSAVRKYGLDYVQNTPLKKAERYCFLPTVAV